MPRKTIEEMLREKAELDKAIAEEEARTNGWTQAMKLAEKLHDKFCHWSHIDQCGWGYEDWNGTTHQRYLRGAVDLIRDWQTIKPSDPDFNDKVLALLVGAINP